ncbi:MAG: metallophosphoesterase family protein [Clostridiales bacterium]|nr:metallophosphoesterase family protein [Clostridiales bacterium]
MKYAVISDVHGNLPALKAVLEDAQKQGVSRYLFAGDYCLSGPWPDECIDLIKDIPEKHVIRGNEERYLENLIGSDQSLWTDGQMQISYWAYRNVSKENLDYILALPHREDLKCSGVKIHMSHHSTDFIGEYPFATWNSPELAERTNKKNKTAEEILDDMVREKDNDENFQEAVAALEEGVYVFGHSHIQWSYASKDRKKYLINPGSCGLPLDGLKDSVPYTILEIADDGEVTVEEIRVPFDKAKYIEKVKGTSQFREANIWTLVIFRELSEATEQLHFFLKHVAQYAGQIGDDRRPFALDTWENAYESWAKSVDK